MGIKNLFLDFFFSKWMIEIGNLGNKIVLENWVVDLFKLELKLLNYILDLMCNRKQYNVGDDNWNLIGIYL